MSQLQTWFDRTARWTAVARVTGVHARSADVGRLTRRGVSCDTSWTRMRHTALRLPVAGRAVWVRDGHRWHSSAARAPRFPRARLARGVVDVAAHTDDRHRPGGASSAGSFAPTRRSPDRRPRVAPRLRSLRGQRQESRLVLLVGVDVPVFHQGLKFFFEDQQRGCFGERLLFPCELALQSSNPLGRRQRRSAFLAQGESPLFVSARSTPSRCRNSVSAAPVRELAFARIRILFSIDQSRLGRFAGMTGRLLASCNHRESVCWRRPVSIASCRALTASVPVNRPIIFCLNARENGFVTNRRLLAPLFNRASERQLS